MKIMSPTITNSRVTIKTLLFGGVTSAADIWIFNGRISYRLSLVNKVKFILVLTGVGLSHEMWGKV